MNVPSSERAVATYSSFRTALLGLTPGDLKCRFYCSGSSCKFCKLYEGPSVIPGLYSTWITDDILAMARPQPVHFENDDIIIHFKKSNIVAVFNLQEPGEHAFCGTGNLVSGFSYDPERFMKNDIFHYNFPLPDFEACLAERMADIVTVMVHELRKGKIAVHCHAGHGRTGTVIAASLMRTRGLSPREAVELVRSKRPSSVQSGEQVRALHSLHEFFSTSAPVIPSQPLRSTSQYIKYSNRILPKKDQRRYGKVPKPLFVSVVALLRLFFTSVVLKLESTVDRLSCFHFECQNPTSYKVSEETTNLLTMGVTARGQAWYIKRANQGMNLLNIEKFVEEETSLVELVSFIDYFISSSFFQLTTSEKLASFLIQTQTNMILMEDWSWSLCIILSCVCLLPERLRIQLSVLTVRWFARCSGNTWKVVHKALQHEMKTNAKSAVDD